MCVFQLPIKNSDHVKFLRYLFDAEKKSDCIYLSRNDKVGKYIVSLLTVGDHPHKSCIPKDYSLIDVVLPKCGTCDYDSHFVWMSAMNVGLLNDHLESLFDLHFHRHMVIADHLGYEKRCAVESFIVLLKLGFSDKNFEKFKKIDYRFRKKCTEIQQKTIQTIVF